MKRILPILLLVILGFACGDPPKDTSSLAALDRKASDDSLKAVIDAMPDVRPAISAFADVDYTLSTLSRMGIGRMRKWDSDELGYMSSTPYYDFGSKSEFNGLKNNLAFYAESPDPKSLRTVKLMLNINNGFGSVAARKKFALVADNTMRKLGIKPPARLKQALLQGRSIKVETPTATIRNEHHEDRIEWERLVIETKLK